MILRVGALLRRSRMASEHSLSVGNCVLDYDAMSVSVDGAPAETIPQMEFKLLFKLLSYPNKIFTRRQLLDVVPAGFLSSRAQYTIRLNSKTERDALQSELRSQGIPSMIYYPIPMHRQGAYRSLDTVVSQCQIGRAHV